MPESNNENGSSDAKYSTLSATTILAIVGLIFTAAQVWMVYAKNDFDKKSKEFDVIVDLFKRCVSTDAADQTFANRFIGVQANTSIATYNNYFANDATFKQAMAECSSLISNNAASAEPAAAALVTPPEALPDSASTGVSQGSPQASGPGTPSAPPNDGARFWIYLGTYSGGVWKTKYLDIPDNFDPSTFNPKTDKNKGKYTVQAAKPLNLRYGSFSSTGDFPPPTATLKPGRSVTVRSTAQWFDSGNWWATVAPPTEH
jgi:hypothetical protein